MPAHELIAALDDDDYQAWIADQSARITVDLPEHRDQATAAMTRCGDILERLREGVAALADPQTLEAFRLANQAMADQRVHSLYALSQRRGEKVALADFWQPGITHGAPFSWHSCCYLFRPLKTCIKIARALQLMRIYSGSPQVAVKLKPI